MDRWPLPWKGLSAYTCILLHICAFTDRPALQTSSAMVWQGSQWASGAANQYPYNHATISSYTVLDQIIQYYNNAAQFPNLKHIVIAGHSLGGQTVHRYAVVGNQLNTRSALAYSL
jgi:hypothetical protein